MSLPSSRQSLRDSTKFSFRVYTRLGSQPTPAAAISGDVLSDAVMLGSAPYASSMRMTVTSLEYAARKNGVAPTSDCHVGLPPPRNGSFDDRRAFTLPP